MTKNLAEDNNPEEVIGLLNFLDDETAEHFSLLSSAEQKRLKKKVQKFVSSHCTEDFNELQKIHETDYADDQEFLDNKQHIIDKITNKIKEEFKAYVIL